MRDPKEYYLLAKEHLGKSAKELSEKTRSFVHGNCDWSLSMPLAIISRGVGIVLGAALVAAGLAFYGLIVFQMTKFVVHAAGAIADFINSKRQTSWTNRSGQDIQSTVLQKKVLQRGEKRIAKVFHAKSVKRKQNPYAIESQYARVCEKIKIVDADGQHLPEACFAFSRAALPPGKIALLKQQVSNGLSRIPARNKKTLTAQQ
ncbi:MAG: hypothetical protein EP349_04115 [Alphaproteobacteria bacterium]|nr:MAG: hypothetical protein EP349_04115 [Alphaproteobacteria bacterium]